MNTEYEKSVREHLHNPLALAMVRAAHESTDSLVGFIRRDGVTVWQIHLGKTRDAMHAWQARLAKYEACLRAATKFAAEADHKLADFAQRPPMFRAHHGRLEVNSLAIREQEEGRRIASQTISECHQGMAVARNQIKSLNVIEEHLIKGIMRALETDQPAAAQALQPINIMTEVVLPAAMTMAITSMPERITSTTIERDPSGNIQTSTQVEMDAGKSTGVI